MLAFQFSSLIHSHIKLTCQVASKNTWLHQTGTERLNVLLILLFHFCVLFILLSERPWLIWKLIHLNVKAIWGFTLFFCALDHFGFFLTWMLLCLVKIVLVVLEIAVSDPIFNMQLLFLLVSMPPVYVWLIEICFKV